MTPRTPLCLVGLLLWLASCALAQSPGHEILSEKAGIIPVHAHLSPYPAAVGPAHLVVDVEDGGPPPPSPSPRFQRYVDVIVDMPSMPGMKPVKTSLHRVGPSRYQADVDLSMEGKWRVRLLVGTHQGDFQMVSMLDVGEEAATPTPPTPPPAISATPAPEETLSILPLTTPPRVGDNRVRIILPPGFDPRAHVMVGVDMPGMTMAVTPREAQRQKDGSYAAVVPLSMQGQWTVTVEAGRLHKKIPLIVPADHSPSTSRVLLYLSTLVLIPIGVWLTLGRRPLAPFLGSAAILISTFGAGAVIQRYWPPDTSMGMAMDMNAPDMGMGDMVAPLPVLVATVGRLPFSVSKRYPGLVLAARERILVSPRGGAVLAMAQAGHLARRGEVVARIGEAELRASAEGVVLRHLVEVGAMVAGGVPVLALGDLDRVRVQLRIPIADHDVIQRGLPVSVLDGMSAVGGNITEVSALAEGDSYLAETVVPNRMAPSASMGKVPRGARKTDRPGMYSVGQNVNVSCLVSQLPSVLCVPREAVRQAATQPAVYVIEEVAGQHVARRRQVSIGLSNDTHTEILSGLREGEQVVAVAEDSLQDGTLVTPGSYATGAYRALLVPRDEGGGHHH